MMVHPLTPAPAITAATTAAVLNKKTIQFPSLTFQGVAAASTNASVSDDNLSRRSLMKVSLGIMAGLVLNSDFRGGTANAAARRPPPPPPEEKKDPNVSGVQAKVLASKKRKEAMKESIAKLREKGKAIQEPSK
ncbi:hypothetical protein FEM48_Zijuj01G0328800 [Ziziphus jujuba var. spinosa]|uniref:Uncharacterized protein n=1 Tax=Ziziphus jujuba var. spinosa TaxID=714518 RepID=A0A978W6N2_ZIZJJ|nr:hypothetical protein FEM48_Zijuj01G0328800 [Ziziphus jujuba var. spinosa]